MEFFFWQYRSGFVRVGGEPGTNNLHNKRNRGDKQAPRTLSVFLSLTLSIDINSLKCESPFFFCCYTLYSSMFGPRFGKGSIETSLLRVRDISCVKKKYCLILFYHDHHPRLQLAHKRKEVRLLNEKIRRLLRLPPNYIATVMNQSRENSQNSGKRIIVYLIWPFCEPPIAV